MDEQEAEMQLAVEEQELQKAAAVKRGETAADEIQRHCTSLLEVMCLAQVGVCIDISISSSHFYSMELM